MNSGKKLSLQYVNRLKLERHEEWEKSIFSDVYEKAILLTKKVIKDNYSTSSANTITYSSDLDGEKFNNIIPFLGERGMGKSSVMLSFSYYLERYDRNTDNSLQFENHIKPFFIALPRIDVAMFIKGESLLDIILANMWNNFQKKSNKEICLKSEVELVRKNFESVKKSYELYRASINGRVAGELKSVRELKELSKCLNLRENFKKLVISYLHYMVEETDGCSKMNFLLITLDDLDVATHDAYEVLEELRLFLMIPNVLVLVSADMGRLFLECNKYFSDVLLSSINSFKQDLIQVRNYSLKYLAKIFPDNMRIFLPHINAEEEGIYEVELPVQNLLSADHTCSIQSVLYKLINKYTGIMLYHKSGVNHMLQKSSLREMVNNLYSLAEISGRGDRKFTEAYDWIKASLNEFCNNMTDWKKQKYLLELLETNENNVGEVLMEILPLLIETRQVAYNVKPNSDEYGDIIKYISDAKTAADREIADFVLLLYSIQIAKHVHKINQQSQENIGNKNAKEDDVFAEKYGKHIFDIMTQKEHIGEFFLRDTLEDEYSNDKVVDMSLPSELFQIEIEWDKSGVIRNFEINAPKINEIICMALICNIELSDMSSPEYNPYNVSGRNEHGMTIELSIKEHYEVSLDFFINNMIRYDRIVRGICRNICKALDINVKTDIIKKISKLSDFRLGNYYLWKQNVLDDKIRKISLTDILPLESVEVILHIAELLKKVPLLKAADTKNTALTAVRNLQNQLNILVRELENVEEWYDDERYANHLKAFIDVFQPLETAKRCAERQMP